LGFYLKQPCDEAVIASTKAATPSPQRLGRWILAATILGSSMSFIDGTAVNVALPSIQANLGATLIQMQWVVEAYALLLAALLLVGGSLGDRLGRRRIFAVGILIFTLASLWCGLAPDVNQLIIGRAIQGIGGALLVPGSLAIISASFSDEARGRAIGTWSGFTAITAAVGPVLGGYLAETLSWRWIFFINLPLAIIVLVIVLTRVPETKNEHATGHMDWLGAGLSVVGLGGLVYGLLESGSKGFDHPAVLVALVTGVASLALFVLVQSKASSPMMPLWIYRSRSFTGATILTLFLYAALGGSLFLFPFNLIQVQGYTATAAGAAWLPFIVIIATLSRWAGGLITRYGAKLPLVIGPAVAAGGFGLLALPGIGGNYWVDYFPAIAVLGLGMAITIAPLVTVVMGSVTTDQAGVASGVNNAISRTASLMAIAVLGVVALTVFNSSLDTKLAQADVPASVVLVLEDERVSLAGARVPQDMDPELRVAVERAIDEAFISGFRVVMLIAAGLALASSGVALVMVDSRHKIEAAAG
jgi:EmrB/QacA subfamily drug resistance transporter